jgi:hypothetical protein
VNYIASISNSCKVRFMLSTQKLTAQVFITFMERLMQERKRKLIWIVAPSGAPLRVSAAVAG